MGRLEASREYIVSSAAAITLFDRSQCGREGGTDRNAPPPCPLPPPIARDPTMVAAPPPGSERTPCLVWAVPGTPSGPAARPPLPWVWLVISLGLVALLGLGFVHSPAGATGVSLWQGTTASPTGRLGSTHIAPRSPPAPYRPAQNVADRAPRLFKTTRKSAPRLVN